MKKTVLLFASLAVIPIILSSCGTQKNNKITPSPAIKTTITPQITKEITKSPLQIDSTKYTFLKYAASDNILTECKHIKKDEFFKSYEKSALSDKLVKDETEISLALKRVTKKDEPIRTGNFIIYNTDNGTFIGTKNSSLQNSICKLPQGYIINKDQVFTNKNADLFFYMNSELFHITSGTQNIDFFRLESTHWFSNNMRFMAMCKQNSDSRDYTIVDFDSLNTSTFNLTKDFLKSQTYTYDNFLVGNNGELIICDGPRQGVGDKWAKNNITYDTVVTGIEANNAYKGTFKGIPLFINNYYLLYTNQLSINKLSLKGNNIVLKYLNFENPYYDLTLEPVGGNSHSGPFHKRSNQCIFSNGLYFTQGSSAYSFDYASIKLDKIVFDATQNIFIKQK